MRQIRIEAFGGRCTSQIGLGCGRLNGRAAFRRSAALVERALDLGIRHFDVAPNYGMGTAEEVLGTVLRGVPDVTLVTKVGIARPPYSRRADLLRWIAKPVLDTIQPLKASLLKIHRRAREKNSMRERFVFSRDVICRSLDDSLRFLARDRVDALLLHAPDPSDLNHEVAAVLEALRAEGRITGFGVGIDEVGDQWAEFGTIWQSRWPRIRISEFTDRCQQSFHGVIRQARTESGSLGRGEANRCVRDACMQAPKALILVSASTPARLSELVQSIE
jgi:aryl-alcohol dehydrogenase-like predicted oxidoreductase